MAQQEDTVLSLLAGIEFKDNRLYDLLNIVVRDLYTLDRQINPPTTRSFSVTGSASSTSDVTGFVATIYGNNVRLTWNAVTGASYYIIKYKSGTAVVGDWATANNILQTSSLSADINPVSISLTIGTHSFLIKSVNSSGAESSTPVIVSITIAQLTAPTISVTVIDNNVLLNWTAPVSQFNIAYYKIFKNGVQSGVMNGTFEAIFETTSGNYTYEVQAVDIVGNLGVKGNVTATVAKPPDYELQDSRVSSLNGTLVNCIKRDTYLLACVNTTETWQQHFVNNSWTNIQGQINAGYPIYIQPSQLTGSYEEVIDYGLLLTNTIVSLRWSQDLIAGSVSVVTKIASSTDGITYTAFTTGTSVFYSSLRYVKFRFEFTATNATGLIKISNIQTLLDVKRETDSGVVSALAANTNGTQVLFNKSFRDVDSITLSVSEQVPAEAIYRFVDTPNPTEFFVYVFDSTGNRVNATVSWKVRGIV